MAALSFAGLGVKAREHEKPEGGEGMGLARDIGGEIVKALAVLALVFLAFAHQPVAIQAADDGLSYSVADLSFCGGAPDDAFALAANARYFIVGGGGYSILMANVNKAMGGTVLSSPADEGPRIVCGGGGWAGCRCLACDHGPLGPTG